MPMPKPRQGESRRQWREKDRASSKGNGSPRAATNAPPVRPREERDDYLQRCRRDLTLGGHNEADAERACAAEFDSGRRTLGTSPGGGDPDLTDGVPASAAAHRPSSPGYEVRAAAQGIGEVYVYEEIGGGLFGGGVTADMVRGDLKNLGGVRELRIYLNSPGGDFFEALAIHSQLRRYPARKVAFIDGLAASAASIIAMAGDQRRAAANAFLMVHDPWGGAIGSAADLRRTADALDKVRGQMVREYVRATGADAGRVERMMAEETWLTADEAMAEGFVDAIDGELAVAARVVGAFDLSAFHYRRPPESAAAGPRAGHEPPLLAPLMIRPAYDRAAKAVSRMQMASVKRP
jgi:ATP-dependent Clp protease protease subunit